MQLRLIDALHPSYPGYQVILKAGDRVSYQCHGFHKTETQTKIITLAQKLTFFLKFLSRVTLGIEITPKQASQKNYYPKIVYITKLFA